MTPRLRPSAPHPGTLARRPSLLVLVAAIVLFGGAGRAEARTWQVPAEASTLAAALDSATAGDVVELAAGVYHESGLTLGAGLTVRAADLESGATIDGGGADRIFHAIGADSISLVGLTLTGGAATNGAAGRFSGCDGLEIRDCTFVANRTSLGIGGALHVTGDSPVTIAECLFQDNDAVFDDGGALWLSVPDAEITGCTFVRNHAVNGGGLSCSGEGVRIVDCVFLENDASNGGGLDLQGVAVEVSGCLFVGNTAARGGAAGCWYGATPLLVDCTLVENAASDQGGALYCTGGSVVTVESSLLAFNVDGGAVACVNGATVGLACSDVYGNVEGDWTACLAGQEGSDGNFSLDPLFCPRTNDAVWVLSAESPCLPANNACDRLVGAFGLGCGDTGASGDAHAPILSRLGSHPNPFNALTVLSFDLERSVPVDLRIYDLGGRLVDVLLHDATLPQGSHAIPWTGRDRAGRPLASGPFFYRLEAGGHAETGRMVLVK